MRRFISAFAVLALSLTFGLHSSGHAVAAAWDLRADQGCSLSYPRTVEAQVSWAMDAPAAMQWIDISDTNNGWQAGTFVSMPVAPNASSGLLTNLAPGATYYVEVAQVYPDGTWIYSPTRALDTRSCFTVSPSKTPYGAYLGQNPNDAPRIVTSLDKTNGTPNVTVKTSTDNNSSSGGGSGGGSGSSSSSGGGANNCGVVLSSGSIVQAPLNASANGTTSISGC